MSSEKSSQTDDEKNTQIPPNPSKLPSQSQLSVDVDQVVKRFEQVYISEPKVEGRHVFDKRANIGRKKSSTTTTSKDEDSSSDDNDYVYSLETEDELKLVVNSIKRGLGIVLPAATDVEELEKWRKFYKLFHMVGFMTGFVKGTMLAPKNAESHKKRTSIDATSKDFQDAKSSVVDPVLQKDINFLFSKLNTIDNDPTNKTVEIEGATPSQVDLEVFNSESFGRDTGNISILDKKLKSLKHDLIDVLEKPKGKKVADNLVEDWGSAMTSIYLILTGASMQDRKAVLDKIAGELQALINKVVSKMHAKLGDEAVSFMKTNNEVSFRKLIVKDFISQQKSMEIKKQ